MVNQRCHTPCPPAAGRPGERASSWPALRKHHLGKPSQSAPERTHAALARQLVVRVNNGVQTVKPLRAALHGGFVGVHFKRQMVTQKHINGFALGYQRFGAVGQQHKVVNIAHVAPHLEGVFDDVVEFMQVNVGKELAAQAANGQAFAWRCVKQRLVGRHLFEQLPLAAKGGRRVYGVLRQDGQHHLVKALTGCLVVGQLGQGFVPKLAQYGAVYAGEKRPYVEFAVPLVPGRRMKCCSRSAGAWVPLRLAKLSSMKRGFHHGSMCRTNHWCTSRSEGVGAKISRSLGSVTAKTVNACGW